MAGIDPRVFSAEAIDPATAQLNEAIEKIQSQMPPIHVQKPAEIRAARERGDGVWGPIVTVPEARVRRIPGPNGEIARARDRAGVAARCLPALPRRRLGARRRASLRRREPAHRAANAGSRW